MSSSACARLVVFQGKQRQGRKALPLDPYCRARSAGGRVKLTCRPVDYSAPISTHLNLDFVRAAQEAHPTYPDQEMFDHLLFGVRFKSRPEYQMVLQPHLSSLMS